MMLAKLNEEYWIKKLANVHPGQIQIVRSDESLESETSNFSIPHAVFDALPRTVPLTQLNKLKLYLLALNVLAFRYSTEQHVAIALPAVGLSGSKTEGGLFLVSDICNEMQIKKILTNIHTQLQEGLRHQQFDIVNMLSRWRINHADRAELPLEIGLFYDEVNSWQDWLNNVKILFCISPGEGKDVVTVRFDGRLYHSQLAKQLANDFIFLIKSIVSKIHANVGDFQLTHYAQALQSICLENHLPPAHTLFEEQVLRTPTAIALISSGREYQYEEINASANKLAHYLIEKCGVKVGDPIALMIERSPFLVISVLAILKSGGVCLPLDTGFPYERKLQIILDSGVKTLITTMDRREEFLGRINNIVTRECGDGMAVSNPLIKVRPDDLIYIIYSSGTTGSPNGIMLEHRSFSNLLKWYDGKYDLKNNPNIIQITRITVDIAFQEIFSALKNGLKLFIPDEELVLDRDGMRQFLLRNQINFIQLIPSMLQVYLAEGDMIPSLRVVLCGGDVLPEATKDLVIKKGYNLYNVYGQTETAIDTLTCKCSTGKVLFDQLVHHYETFVLNADGDVLPPGIAGELCTAGIGLARGYLNNPELTAQRFLPHPFKANERMYRTGDRVRMHMDGKIEFLGRTDNQVKVRGFRVELSDIEETLRSHESVVQAIVLQDPTDKDLVAFIIDADCDLNDVQWHARRLLPAYMVPSHFNIVDTFPLSDEGKIDRKALLKMSSAKSRLPGASIVFENKTEEVLLQIWKEELNITHLSLNDNFFDLGGHSLNAIDIMARIQKELNIKVAFAELFNFPTIKSLARQIIGVDGAGFEPIEPMPSLPDYELSPAQKRLWVLASLEEHQVVYNIPLAYKIEGECNVEILKQSFQILMDRHEVLRTSFRSIDGHPRQVVHQNLPLPFEFVESGGEDDQARAQFLERQINRTFDFSQGPLFHVLVMRQNNVYHVFVTFHHIIVDGVSIEKLETEFLIVYQSLIEAKPILLPPLRIQYKDYAHWHNRRIESAEYKQRFEYWKAELKESPAFTRLPFDFARPDLPVFKGASVSAEVDPKTSERIRAKAREYGTTLHAYLLTGYFILLSRYSMEQDIIVGVPYGGRGHADLQAVVGMFVNMLPIRLCSDGDFSQPAHSMVQSVHRKVSGAIEHEWEFEKIVEALNARTADFRNPLFNTAFEFAGNSNKPAAASGGNHISTVPVHSGASHFDMQLIVTDGDERFLISLNYITSLFKASTATMMLGHYADILRQMTGSAEHDIGSIRIAHNLLEPKKMNLVQETMFAFDE